MRSHRMCACTCCCSVLWWYGSVWTGSQIYTRVSASLWSSLWPAVWSPCLLHLRALKRTQHMLTWAFKIIRLLLMWGKRVCTGEVGFVHGVCVHHLSYQLYRVVEELGGSDVGSGFRASLFEQSQQVIGSDRTVWYRRFRSDRDGK